MTNSDCVQASITMLTVLQQKERGKEEARMESNCWPSALRAKSMLSVICESVYMRIKGGHAANQYARRFPFNQVRVNGARTKYHIPNTKYQMLYNVHRAKGWGHWKARQGHETHFVYFFFVVFCIFWYFCRALNFDELSHVNGRVWRQGVRVLNNYFCSTCGMWNSLRCLGIYAPSTDLHVIYVHDL